MPDGTIPTCFFNRGTAATESDRCAHANPLEEVVKNVLTERRDRQMCSRIISLPDNPSYPSQNSALPALR